MLRVSRRDFVRMSAYGAGSIFVTSALGSLLTACSDEMDAREGRFEHGIASGDPLTTQVIIWTRVTPEDETATQIRVYWDIASDPDFSSLVARGNGLTTVDQDFTVKADIVDLTPGTTYYYRFSAGSNTSVVGSTATLPEGDVDRVKFAVMSCSNYPAGYFHAYAEAARIGDLDAVLHLGDYIYEYARGEYASQDAAALGREVRPEGELLSLDDYRTRYAQYRSDPDLQSLHQSVPFIVVWDDHEIANDAWLEGAENHSDDDNEGSFVDRLNSALQAYAEWMPIRPGVDSDIASLARNFEYGNLVNQCMLDTRLVARDRQLSLANYIDGNGNFDTTTYGADISNPTRSLIGQDQVSWLSTQFSTSSTWHVLGQQVLMGTMELPAAVALQQLSIEEFAELAALAQLAMTNPDALTPEQRQLVETRGPLLQLGSIPYNLDAWDGYPAERARVLTAALQSDANLVVLAGDTHNAWANNINLQGQAVGVEFATPGVSSPGLETFLSLDTDERIAQTEAGLVQLIEDLQYTNLSDRGFLVVEFTQESIKAEWIYVSSVKEATYTTLDARQKNITVNIDTNQIIN